MSTPKAYVRRLYEGLKWHESVEYTLLALLAVAIPVYWQIGVWLLILLCANTVVRIIVTRHIGNPSIGRSIRTCLCLMAAYYLTFAISATYSSRTDEALDTVTTMLPLLLFPILFMLSDTRYLQRRHLSTLTYLLAATLTIRFLIMLIRSALHTTDSLLFSSTTDIFANILVQLSSWLSQETPIHPFNDLLALLPIRAVAHLFNNTPLEHLATYQFDPLHHNYLSLYLLTAVALLYAELVRCWQLPRWRIARWIVIADMGFLSAYVLLSGSRSGIVVWILLVTACLLHLVIGKKQWRSFAIIVAAIALLVGVTYLASPKTYQRILFTAQDMLSGREGDVRQSLWQSGLAAFKEHPVVGYGCDGYWEVLFQQYRTHDCLHASIMQFSTHNQYIETLLATGLVGLVVLLAMELFPVILAFRRPQRNLPMLLFSVVYMSCIFFEATFGRQMGLLFIGFWYCLLLLYSRTYTPIPKG